jgi:hypothetical protein
MSLNVPKPHSSGMRERQVLCVYNSKKKKKKNFCFLIEIIYSILTVIPHHSHLIPARHSLDQHVFRHMAHFEFVGKFPSRQ